MSNNQFIFKSLGSVTVSLNYDIIISLMILSLILTVPTSTSISKIDEGNGQVLYAYKTCDLIAKVFSKKGPRAKIKVLMKIIFFIDNYSL